MGDEGASRYQISRALGRGGMGVVHEALDTVLGRRVAVKFCRVDEAVAKQQLEFEARSASRLNHPNIAQVYDYGETSAGQPYIVMEYVDGRNLNELIAGRPLEIPEAVRVVAAVAEALREAHRHGVIHRDIKPANIRITSRNQVKVLDFGLARVVAPATDQTQTIAGEAQSVAGQLKGTPPFMSPEQARGRPVDHRSDLFSLGTVFYQCLTGQRPFEGDSLVETLAQVIQRDPPPPSALNPECPPELDRVTLRLLAKDPERRYQSAEELLEDLPALSVQQMSRTLALGDTARAAGPAPAPSVSITLTRRKMWLGAAAVALLAVALGLAVYWRARPYEPDVRAGRWYAQGMAALQDGTWLKASKAFQQAVTIDPAFAVAHARLAEAWNALDYSDRAREEMLRAGAAGGARLRVNRSDALLVEAIRAGLTHDIDTSIARLAERERTAGNEEKALAAFDLARAYVAAERPKEALEALERARAADEQFAAAHLLSGTILVRQRDHAGAEEALRRAEALYQASSSLEGIAEVNYQRAQIAMRAKGSDARASQVLLEKVIASAETTGNEPQKIKAQLALVGLLLDGGDTVRAEKLAGEAVRLARATGVETLHIRALVDTGNCYLTAGRHREAEANYVEALNAARRLSNRRSEALARANYGSLLVADGRLQEALEHLTEVVRFYETGVSRSNLFPALVLLGRAQRNLGDLDAAGVTFERVLAMAEESGNALEIARAEESLASIEVWRENFGSALTRYERSQAFYAKAESQIGMAYTGVARGFVLARLGRFEEALAHYQEAEAYGRPQKLASLLFSAAHAAGWTYLFMGKLPEARRQLEQVRLHRSSPEEVRIEERQLAVAIALQSGAARAARTECDHLLQRPVVSTDPFAGDRLRLLCAEALLETGEAARAGELAAEVGERFAQRRQRESEWRAWALVARTTPARTDAAQRAGAAYAALQAQFPADDWPRFQKRADVLRLRKHL
jgi:tetratricopeptide (TPR) repeat protein/tRNA A-37 threonylcarbamoyl transferase component Bud32